jgi:hypothetical protein
MPEMKNFHGALGFANAIIDQDRRMYQLAHTSLSLYQAADVWKGFENVEMVQYGIAKFPGGRGKGGPRISQDFLEIC